MVSKAMEDAVLTDGAAILLEKLSRMEAEIASLKKRQTNTEGTIGKILHILEDAAK